MRTRIVHVERQARDLEVRVRVPVQFHIFLLKFNDETYNFNVRFSNWV